MPRRPPRAGPAVPKVPRPRPAAAALRESALAKLHKAHGIPRRAEPAAVVATVAARTGRDPATLYELLYGRPPLTTPP